MALVHILNFFLSTLQFTPTSDPLKPHLGHPSLSLLVGHLLPLILNGSEFWDVVLEPFFPVSSLLLGALIYPGASVTINVLKTSALVS